MRPSPGSYPGRTGPRADRSSRHGKRQGRDAQGRRIRCAGREITGGTDDSWFTVYGSDEAPIAHPVAMRFRTPLRWSWCAFRFVLKDVPLSR